MTGRRCVYVTSGWGIHDIRWTDALRHVEFDPQIVRLGIDASNPAELRQLVDQAAGPDVPVLAGPLDSVTSHLIGIKAPIIGLSWGFDLHTMSDRSWLPQLHGLIVDSDATARIATSAGVAPAAITFLPWGVDIERFTPDGPRADLTRCGVPTSARTVLSLRAHESLYRVSDILEGFALTSREVTDLHLLIGHSGSLTDELRSQAGALGIEGRTHFIGSLPEEQLPEILRATNVYVSASEVDGTSVTLLQAMACGTPVLTSDTEGNRPWVQPGVTGHVFRTGDPHDLAEQLTTLLSRATIANRPLSEQARALVVERADWPTNLERLRDALSVDEI